MKNTEYETARTVILKESHTLQMKTDMELLAQQKTSKASKKKSIAILFGGCSAEYDVSVQSAYAVIRYMDQNNYRPILIGITRSGDWYFYGGDVEKIPTDTWYSPDTCIPILFSQSKKQHGFVALSHGKRIPISLDAAFPVLHGRNGEDGTVQGILELAGIPVIGCGTLCSALCMDKDMAHRIVAASGIRVPRSVVISKEQDITPALTLAKETGYSLFVKPMRSGSSFGITKVKHFSELTPAIQNAMQHDNRIIIEEAIDGFEVGCAILGTEKLTLGALDEIEISGDFFDFTEKYTLKTSKIHVPARISDEKSTQVKQTAQKIYRALGCSCFARVDLFLQKDGTIVFNEVNTIPGLTTHSRFPNMMHAIGISFEELVSRFVETGVNK